MRLYDDISAGCCLVHYNNAALVTNISRLIAVNGNICVKY